MANIYDVETAQRVIEHHENPRKRVAAAQALIRELHAAFPVPSAPCFALSARLDPEGLFVTILRSRERLDDSSGWVRVLWDETHNALVARAWKGEGVAERFPIPFITFDSKRGVYVDNRDPIHGDALVALVEAILSADALVPAE